MHVVLPLPAERNHGSRRAVKMSTMALDLVILFLKRKIKLRRARYSGVRAILKSGAFFYQSCLFEDEKVIALFFFLCRRMKCFPIEYEKLVQGINGLFGCWLVQH